MSVFKIAAISIAIRNAVPSMPMSSARRAYDLIRGYVSHGWEHLSEDEESLAHRELKAAIENPAPGTSVERPEVVVPQSPITLEQARNLFGVNSGATSQQITDAYDLLRTTIDLSKFPENSDSWQRARALGRRLDNARNILMENIDPTVRRFERLEIE